MHLGLRFRVALGASMLALAACSVSVDIGATTWTAECGVVPFDTCREVTAIFVNNLAWDGGWIHDASGGRVRVSSASCPASPNPDALASLDLSECWRAEASIPKSRACMIIARQKHPDEALLPYGQAGGDDYTGLAGAPDPGTTPC